MHLKEDVSAEITLNVNKLLAVLLLYVFIRFFILHFVVGCLLLYRLLFVYADVVAIFLFIH